jgi:hypothetical protein
VPVPVLRSYLTPPRPGHFNTATHLTRYAQRRSAPSRHLLKKARCRAGAPLPPFAPIPPALRAPPRLQAGRHRLRPCRPAFRHQIKPESSGRTVTAITPTQSTLRSLSRPINHQPFFPPPRPPHTPATLQGSSEPSSIRASATPPTSATLHPGLPPSLPPLQAWPPATGTRCSIRLVRGSFLADPAPSGFNTAIISRAPRNTRVADHAYGAPATPLNTPLPNTPDTPAVRAPVRA